MLKRTSYLCGPLLLRTGALTYLSLRQAEGARRGAPISAPRCPPASHCTRGLGMPAYLTCVMRGWEQRQRSGRT